MSDGDAGVGEGLAAQPAPSEVRDVVLILHEDVARALREAVARYPGAELHVLCPPEAVDTGETLAPMVRLYPCSNLEEVRETLRRLPRPQVLAEAGDHRPVVKRASLVHLLWFVAPGGSYVIKDLDVAGGYAAGPSGSVSAHLGRVARAQALGADGVPDEAGWVKAAAGTVTGVRIRGVTAELTIGGRPYQYALRHDDTDAVLDARYGVGVAHDVLEQRAPCTFVSRAELTVHGEGPAVGRESFAVPARTLRRYYEVTCFPRQLARLGDYWLPDTFRHFAHQRLTHRKLERATPDFQRLPQEPRRTRRLDGEYFYVDTELPGHFGHVTTEVLARFWGWRRALAENPELRLLASHYVDTPARVPSFQREMLAAFGIDQERVDLVSAGEAVQVERLVAATPQFENPYVVDGDVVETWAELSERLPHGPPAVESDRIFVSRRPSGKRDCLDAPEIERYFADQGFTVVFPEDLPYWQQVRTFEQARVIAGFGGSGMFSMMFAPQARVILLASNAYTAQNEYLFAAANGNEIHYFWGDSLVPRGERWSMEAFSSNFTFDLAAHRGDLDKLLA